MARVQNVVRENYSEQSHETSHTFHNMLQKVQFLSDVVISQWQIVSQETTPANVAQEKQPAKETHSPKHELQEVTAHKMCVHF